METRDPKHLIGVWVRSDEYRTWIHKNRQCYCGQPLSEQDGWLHHDANTGGKKPLDALLTRFCAGCHQKLHYSANSKEVLYKRFGLDDSLVREDCARMLGDFAIEKFGANAVINQLTEFLR